MVRVMGAIMTGIIMAGRTGAAFAAQLGTMEVNEEIDAFKTMGIPPIEFLVPASYVRPYSDDAPALSLCGSDGYFRRPDCGSGHAGPEHYRNTTIKPGPLSAFTIFLSEFSRGWCFGILVAVAGCLRGLQCGRNATAVGQATTSAVVTGIVSIIVATAIITVACNVLGI